MQYKKYTKQSVESIQGLRSFKDTLPKNIKKVIDKRGHIYSEILNNWRNMVGTELFDVCYPKSFKNSNIFGGSSLLVMVKRGHEVDLEYSKKKIINNINNFFNHRVVQELKFNSFDYETVKSTVFDKKLPPKKIQDNSKFKKKIFGVKNEKIKKSLLELSEFFKKK